MILAEDADEAKTWLDEKGDGQLTHSRKLQDLDLSAVVRRARRLRQNVALNPSITENISVCDCCGARPRSDLPRCIICASVSCEIMWRHSSVSATTG